jgi:hypothetical protein
MAHKCPIRRCPIKVTDAHLMCRTHWLQVPKALRDAVWEAYHDHGIGSDELRAAQDAAIAHIHAGEEARR